MSRHEETSFIEKFASHPHYIVPQGPQLHAKSWQTEAALRMLLNSLSEGLAQDPSQLIVHEGTGQPARNVPSLQKIIYHLLNLAEDQSLLIQSGKPITVLPTYREAPRVLIANNNIVPHWATWQQFNELKTKGLMMYGASDVGSWIYTGSQSFLQESYETFAAVGRRYFQGTLEGRLVISGGLGAMGGAQPLAVTLNNGVFLGIDINSNHIERHVKMGYLDKMTNDYEQAKLWVMQARVDKSPLSVGLVGDIGVILQRFIQDQLIPDVITDQTAASDPLYGYIPQGLTVETARQLRAINPTSYLERSLASMASHVRSMLEMQQKGAIAFEYGNNLREGARKGGETHAFELQSFFPNFIRPLCCEGKGSFIWIALSGEAEDVYTIEKSLIKLFPENSALHTWLKIAKEKIPFEGLPARTCLLSIEERIAAALHINQMVRQGQLQAPVVITRSLQDSSASASPYRETEAMRDGSDSIADWTLLNLLANCAAGASWVSVQQGGGVGIGYSQQIGMALVADGTEQAEQSIKRVLINDGVIGLIRHADAGYEGAIEKTTTYGLCC